MNGRILITDDQGKTLNVAYGQAFSLSAPIVTETTALSSMADPPRARVVIDRPRVLPTNRKARRARAAKARKC